MQAKGRADLEELEAFVRCFYLAIRSERWLKE